MNKNTIILGMSGGVDSSVCAYLLKKKFNVIGLFMHNWDNYTNNDLLGQTKNNSCDLYKDYSDVLEIGKILNISVEKVNFVKQYWNDVFKKTLNEYEKGYTPNPDVLCNKYIKFGQFLDYCKQHYNCSKIAMGHYANTKVINGIKYLTMAKDKNKDQTYFLCWINQEQLNSCIFPLGNIKKTKVRLIAKKNNLVTWNKKDSTGICFIGERNFKEFLKNYFKPKPGSFIDIVSNKEIGIHEGYIFYTIGQNKGLNIGGNKFKYFVCKKDVTNNIVYVVDEKNKNKYLTTTKCELINFNWINGKIWKNNKVKIRFRHRQKLINGSFYFENDRMFINYKKTIGVCEGQYAVLYYKDICLGGGVIRNLIN